MTQPMLVGLNTSSKLKSQQANFAFPIYFASQLHFHSFWPNQCNPTTKLASSYTYCKSPATIIKKIASNNDKKEEKQEDRLWWSQNFVLNKKKNNNNDPDETFLKLTSIANLWIKIVTLTWPFWQPRSVTSFKKTKFCVMFIKFKKVTSGNHVQRMKTRPDVTFLNLTGMT